MAKMSTKGYEFIFTVIATSDYKALLVFIYTSLERETVSCLRIPKRSKRTSPPTMSQLTRVERQA